MKPTKPGFYWAKFTEPRVASEPWMPVEVRERRSRVGDTFMSVYAPGDTEAWSLEDFVFHPYAGPIPQPD